jgi:hypothetical protein
LKRSFLGGNIATGEPQSLAFHRLQEQREQAPDGLRSFDLMA